MTKPKDGGAAFPHKPDPIADSEGNILSYPDTVPGLTKREWFAGMALQGILTRTGSPLSRMPSNEVAETCFEFADAMLKEGEK